MLARTLTLLAFILLPFEQSCSESTYDIGSRCELDGVNIYEDSIAICGTINAAMARQFRTAVEQTNPARVFINSDGGQGRHAIELTEIINSREIDVILGGKCISACAHFILTLSKSVTVTPNTLIAFHHSYFGNLRLLDQNRHIDEESYNFSFFRYGAEIETNAYESYGLNSLWLAEPIWRIRPRCIDNLLTDDISSIVTGIRWKSKYAFWTPTRSYLNYVRTTPIKGWWPADQEELRSLASGLSIRDPRRFIMQKDGEPHVFLSAYHYEFPKCEDSDLSADR